MFVVTSFISFSVISKFTCSVLPLTTTSTSILGNIKQTIFQVLFLSGVPASTLISENHTVPFDILSYPPSRKPICTCVLVFELNSKVISCQSAVCDTICEVSVVSAMQICAPAFLLLSSFCTFSTFTLQVTLYIVFGVTSITRENMASL